MMQRCIVVIGMGYVGIPAAALLADVPGHHVTGVQRRSERSGWKIDLLNSGGSPFPPNEPGIAELIRRVAVEKRSFHVTESWEAVTEADVVLIDVQTPVEVGDHEPHYESLREAARCTGQRLRRGTLVCVESTVAPGTTHHVVRPLLEEASGLTAGKDFHLCFSYERVMVGRLLHNIVHYPRIVGGETPECANLGAELYRTIVQNQVLTCDSLTAEVAKTVENAYRDVNIAFANEVALACEALGVDVYTVRGFVNNLPNDPSNPGANPVRNMHLPGAGVGGHCLPKDSWLLRYGLEKYGSSPVDLRVIIGARHVNDAMPRHMADLAEAALKRASVPLGSAKVAVLGYAFLEDCDDTRNTPARPLIDELRRRGIRQISIHDPYVREEELPEVERDLSRSLKGADCLCLVTKHSMYAELKPESVQALMRHAIVIDGRNLFKDWDASGPVRVMTVGKG
jgi:UDP-N-acetyl-D-mannosaminuronic acid dehydrogenase